MHQFEYSLLLLRTDQYSLLKGLKDGSERCLLVGLQHFDSYFDSSLWQARIALVHVVLHSLT